jgi:16S rRNA (guanine527-N7)-methyltransferase
MMFPIENLLSPSTLGKFKTYQLLLEEWNQRTSLVQENTLNDFYNRHILDSLQLIPLLDPLNTPLKKHDIPPILLAYIESGIMLDNRIGNGRELSIVDVGTGAGFPGLVLAICGFSNITLCESNFKKCVFLGEVARQTDTVVSIANKRVEDVVEKFDVVLSRALTELVKLCFIMKQLSRNPNSLGVFHKGKAWKDEVKEAHKCWEFELGCYKSITSDEGVILSLNQLKSKKIVF